MRKTAAGLVLLSVCVAMPMFGIGDGDLRKCVNCHVGVLEMSTSSQPGQRVNKPSQPCALPKFLKQWLSDTAQKTPSVTNRTR